MCGIAGIFAYGRVAEPVVRNELLAIRDYMTARGPDAAGLWFDADQRIGLAHRRLAIIDLDDRASQPMHTDDGRYAITFNGEIYNYRELRQELTERGAKFSTTSDTEVILQLYRLDGAAIIRRLRGMFAFAIWDAVRQELFLARDSYGIKPLYYADDGGSVRFASQVRALMAGGGLADTPSAAGWAGFYLFGTVPEPYTTFANVRALPAGANVLVSLGGMGKMRHAPSVADAFASAESRFSLEKSPDEVAERVRVALSESTSYHMVADVPVGAFLSGGIDSGALVGLMRDVGHADIQTMTVSFEGYHGCSEDEAPLAAEVARLYGTRHTCRVVTESEFRADLPRILAAMDQPSIDGVNTWFASKVAAELGIKVVVSGLGGDELFGGYPSFRDLPRSVALFGPLTRAPRLGRAIRHAVTLSSIARLGISAKTAGLVEFGGTPAGAYLLRRGLFMPWEIKRLMPAPEAAHGLAELDVLALIGHSIEAAPATGFATVASLEASLYMRNQLLRDADWASMAHSIEVRVPLVDRFLLEQLAGLPLGLPEFAGKRLLSMAPGLALPELIRTRPKTGFTTPIGRWLGNLMMPSAKHADTRVRHEHWSRNWARFIAAEFLGDHAEVKEFGIATA